MLLGVGVDLLHLTRLRAMLSRREPARLAARILSDEERAQWNDLAASPEQSERFLALRWTAKEAAYKALYPALVPRWSDLTVSKQGPKPILSLSTSCLKFVRPPTVDPDRVRLHLSVSHDADLMVAYVVAELLNKGT
ncbi:4'-phosphopantetheinyl transferase [Rhodotorula sp. JG-1b]|nr:4'-phosphopantetheinyl transferase [Rhodotorula sp. JG-1b]